MNTTLIIFSGLPGSGKTTLSLPVAKRLNLPLLRIDDIVDFIPAHMRDHANPFWDDMIGIMLKLAEAQLKIGLSVVIDSVFMGDDRSWAQAIALKHNARFRAIHTFVSDENLWRERVLRRIETAPPEDEPATWERIQIQRQSFQIWQPNAALFIDGIDPLEKNLEKIMSFINA